MSKTSGRTVMDIAEERAPEGFARIEDVIPLAELEQHARAYKDVAGFDVDALNGRTSYSVGQPVT